MFQTSSLRTSSARVLRELRVHMCSRHAGERYVGAPNAVQRPDLAQGAHYVRCRGSAGRSVNAERQPLAFGNTHPQLSLLRPASRRSTYTARRAHRRHPRRPVFGTSPYARCPAFIRPHRLPCSGNSKATIPAGRLARYMHHSSGVAPLCRQVVWPGRGRFSRFSPRRSAASHGGTRHLSGQG